MRTLSLLEVQGLMEKVRSQMLSSNDIVDRKAFPYYHSHPSVPNALKLYKQIMVEYRSTSAQLVGKYGQQMMGSIPIDFSEGTLFNILVTSIIMASLGLGDCADLVNKLATEAILIGCGDLFFVKLSLANHKPGMEMGHALLVLNVKKPPAFVANMNIEDFIRGLPRESIIADPFLGITFAPPVIPQELRNYIDAYGGKAQLMPDSSHIFNFSVAVLTDHCISKAVTVLKKIKAEQLLSSEKLFQLALKNPLDHSTAILDLLNDSTKLSFRGYVGISSPEICVDAIAIIANKTDRKEAIVLCARLGLPESQARFARDEQGRQIFVTYDVNETSQAQLLTAELKKTYQEKVGMINVDFKWRDGKITLLELGDAVNASGYRGYNRLYGRNADDEVMLREMISFLQKRYIRLHFILNGLPETYWPTRQLSGINYYPTVFDFFKFVKTQPRGSFKSDILIFGEHHGGKTALTSRNAAEMQAWLLAHDIEMPVLNAPAMVDAADDKFIFKQVMKNIPKTYLINLRSLSSEFIQKVETCGSEELVLKPYDATRGIGVLMLTKKECVEHLGAFTTYFSQPNKLLKIPTFLDDYRRIKCQELHGFISEKHQEHVLLQPYIASDFVEISDKHYDPTGRMVLFLRKDISGQCEVDVIDGYWKLPEKSIEEGHYHESARLSHVDAGAHKGSAKFSPEQSTNIRQAFRLLSKEFKPLLGSKIDFYTDNFFKALPNERALLDRFFSEQIFDIIQPRHFSRLSEIARVNVGLGTALVRTLNAELSSFVNLMQANKEEPKFLQQDLLAYLADDACPIDFKKVVYGGDERIGLQNFLSFIQIMPSTKEFSEDAKKLARKI